jgi:hypothetical protein
MMGKSHVDREDEALARKILLDAVPSSALAVLRALPLDGYWTVEQIRKASGQPLPKVQAWIESLRICRAVSLEEGLKTDRDGRRRIQPRADYYTVGPELQRCLMAGW